MEIVIVLHGDGSPGSDISMTKTLAPPSAESGKGLKILERCGQGKLARRNTRNCRVGKSVRAKYAGGCRRRHVSYCFR